MKNYSVSKFSVGIYFAGLPFLVLYAPFAIMNLQELIATWKNVNILWFNLLIFLFYVFGIISYLYIALRDMPFAKFSVSEEGITESVGIKTYFHSWAEFQEYGIIGSHVEYVMGTPVAETYWIYFSTTYLTSRERQHFLRKTRKDLSKIAFFQYNQTILNEIIPILPEMIASKLIEQSEELEQQMNWIEKMYNG